MSVEGMAAAQGHPPGGEPDAVRAALAAVPHGRLRLTGAAFLAAAASAASVALLAVSTWLLSRAAEHPPVLYLQVAAVGVRFFGISRGVFRYTERLVSHDIALRMQSALRLASYRRLSSTTLLGRRRGDLLARVVSDVAAVQDLVVRVWLPLASASLVVVGTGVALSFFSVGSAAVLLASAVAAGLVVPLLARRASSSADAAVVPLRGALADAIYELSRNAADLVAYGADDRSTERLMAIDTKLRRLEDRTAWVRGIAGAAQVVAAGLAVIAALVIGGQQVAGGTLKPVMLAVLVLTPLAMHDVMSALTSAAQTSTRIRTALHRVQAVLDEPAVGRGDTRATPVVPVPRLTLTDVTVGWPAAEPLLAGLNLTVSAGEKVAVVGPSGIGKTTLAATILGLLPPVWGSTSVIGRPGYLAQDAHIFATSIAENVRIGNKDATDAQVAAALTAAGLELPLDRVVGESGATLSGGEARRLALSRLLVGDYQVLILDEPTEHLDPSTAERLLADIDVRAARLPVLIMSHDPAVIARCDRVVSLERYVPPVAQLPS